MLTLPGYYRRPVKQEPQSILYSHLVQFRITWMPSDVQSEVLLSVGTVELILTKGPATLTITTSATAPLSTPVGLSRMLQVNLSNVNPDLYVYNNQGLYIMLSDVATIPDGTYVCSIKPVYSVYNRLITSKQTQIADSYNNSVVVTGGVQLKSDTAGVMFKVSDKTFSLMRPIAREVADRYIKCINGVTATDGNFQLRILND